MSDFINLDIIQETVNNYFTSLQSATGSPTQDNAGQISGTDGGDLDIVTDYFIQSSFIKNPMTVMMPVASPNGFQGDTVAFVQLASPTLKWIAKWTAAKFNVPPTAPDPTPTDPSWVLLSEEMTPVGITYGADAAIPLYRLSGTYVYGHVNPNNPINEYVVFGVRPDFLPPQTTGLPALYLSQGIINPSVT